jgi:hypothetical protein
LNQTPPYVFVVLNSSFGEGIINIDHDLLNMPKSINASDLKKLAKARLDDAIILYKQQRYEGAIYLCGYAVELALKYKICQRLGWNKYLPAKFDNDRTFYTHKLEDLKK